MPEPYRIGKHRGKYALIHGNPRKRIALGTNDLGVAEAQAAAMWQALTAPKSDRTVDLWGRYLEGRIAQAVPILDHNRSWKYLEPHFGYKIGDQVNEQDCREYIGFRHKQGAANSTVRQELSLLRACLNYRYGKGQTRLQLPPPSAPRERFLTKTEVERLLEHVQAPHIRLFITLAITTGARMGAILEAKWDQVDFGTKTINYLPAGRHQTSKRRTVVPLNKRAFAAVSQAKAVAVTDSLIEYNGEPITNIRWAIKRASLRAGVPCSPHVFRHTAGVWLAQADIPMQKIAQYLGHKNMTITEEVYARYSPSYQVEAARELDW